jgi:hypothetical protein
MVYWFWVNNKGAAITALVGLALVLLGWCWLGRGVGWFAWLLVGGVDTK